jgi:hypothetical protein
MKGMKMRWFITWPISVLFAVGAPALASPMQPSGHQSSGRVDRDDQGIPHIFAKTERDLYFLTGWMHAQDRFFQMDAARHQASGTLAELLGPDALGGDVETRNLGIRRAAQRSLTQLSKPVQKALEAYSAGVNAYRAEHPLPPEYAALEVTKVAPWTPLDSVAVAKAISYSLSFELDIGPTQRLRQYQDAGAREGFDGTALYFQDLSRTAHPSTPRRRSRTLLRGRARLSGAWRKAVRSAPMFRLLVRDPGATLIRSRFTVRCGSPRQDLSAAMNGSSVDGSRRAAVRCSPTIPI